MSKKNKDQKGHVAPVSNDPEQAKTPAQPGGGITVLGKHLGSAEPSGPQTEGRVVTYTETDYSLVFPDEMTEPQFLAVAQKLGEAASGLGWRVGDLANFGKAKYGYKDYEKLTEVTGFAEVYLRTCSSISSRIPAPFRNLASMERFRLLLAMPNENMALPEGAPAGAVAHVENIAEKVERLNEWTAAELRNKQRTSPKTVGDGTGSGVPSVGGSPTGTTTGMSDAPSAVASATDAASDSQTPSGGLSSTSKPEKVITASRVHEMLGELHDALQALTAERLATFAVIEEKLPRLPQTLALLKILRDQVRIELAKS